MLVTGTCIEVAFLITVQKTSIMLFSWLDHLKLRGLLKIVGLVLGENKVISDWLREILALFVKDLHLPFDLNPNQIYHLFLSLINIANFFIFIFNQYC
jgi:hypothetical protein